MKANGTNGHQRQPKRELTGPQLEAVDLLAGGKTDKEAAEALNLPRASVARWRLYDPVFQAALNRRRAEVWAAGIDRLRSLVPKALDALAEELGGKDSANRVKAAGAVLRLVQLPALSQGIGPTDPGVIVRQVVEARRRPARGLLDDVLDGDKGLPPFERHLEQTWAELEGQAGVAEGERP
jgi:hypothetical protein